MYLGDHDSGREGGDCPDGTELEPTDLYFGLEASPSVCECSCGEASDVVCDSTVLEFHGNDPACATPDATFSLTYLVSGCVEDPSAAVDGYWSAPPLGIDGGSCAPTSGESIASPSWDGSSYVCGLDTSALARCESDGICAGPAEPSFEHGTCVWREGDHSCEGLGAFSEKELRWTGFEDNRECSTCSCEAPEGECAGELWLYGADDCSSGLDRMPTDGTCFQSDIAVESAVLRGSAAGCGGACQQVVSASCAPAGGEPVGSAEPTGTRTYCCTG